jgi:AraC-like DNA-binding protein
VALPVTQHTVAVQQVRLILQGAQHQGRPTAPLMQRAGIPPALLDAPLARVSQQQYALLIRVLRRSLRDELWGLCSQPLPVGSFGRGAAQLVHCQTLEDALRLGFRHHHGLLVDFVPRLVLQGGVARVQLLRRVPLNPRLDYAQKAFLLFTFGLACWLVARRVPVLGVDYTEPAPRSDSSRVYQAPIRHDQTHVGLSFDARWLDLPVVQSPQSLREFLAGAPANLLIKYRDSGSVSERIRRLLYRRLDAGDLSLEAVGEAMAVAPQTLRRRLRDEGHGFQALKDALRRDAAIAHLARPELTLPEIAQRLGFSEASTFHRAFKKWCGVAPGAYRLTHLAELPAASRVLPASAPASATGSP